LIFQEGAFMCKDFADDDPETPTGLLPGTDPDDWDLLETALNDPKADEFLPKTEELPAVPSTPPPDDE